MTDRDHPDTDLTDPHGEAEALRRENARLKDEVARLARDHEFEGWAYKCQRERDAAIDRAEAAEAALAAIRAPDPVVNAGSCQPGDLISREAAVEVAASIADRQCPDNMPHDAYMAYHSGAMDVLDAIRALPAAPVAEAQPTIGGAELDELVRHLREAGLHYTLCQRAADAITALRAQPDWKAMAERLGEALGLLAIATGTQDAGGKVRAALSDLAKMKGE